MLNLIYGDKLVFDSHLEVRFLYTILYSVSLGYANQAVFIYLDKVFVNERFTLKRMVIGFVSSFIVTLLIILLLRIFEDVVIEGNSFEKYWVNESLGNYVFAIVMTFIILLSFYTFYIYKAYSDSKVKEQKIIVGTASAQFESLKNQIDPHFLFNSLNVLSSLIEENPELDPKDFYRVSRKFIVPMKGIKEIQIYSNSRLKVILSTYKEDEVIVARERVNDFKEWLG